jgi:hypothetical protein
MSRPLEHEDCVAFRLPAAMHQTLATAAASLGTSKSEFMRAVILKALRDEQLARAALDDIEPTRPVYPQFVSA